METQNTTLAPRASLVLHDWQGAKQLPHSEQSENLLTMIK